MIVVRLAGGTGNQMFQYAAARALAEKHKTIVKLDLDVLALRNSKSEFTRYYDYELEPFKTMQNFATEKEKFSFMPFSKNICSRIYYKIKHFFAPRRFYKQIGDRFDNNFFDLPDNYCIEGRFQSEKFFKQYESVIRREFELKRELPANAKTIEQQILSSNSIGVQVRRADYVTDPHFKELLGSKDLSYYQKGIEQITKGAANYHIYVVSDDIPWCKENLKFDLPTTFLSNDIVGENHHIQMYILSCCKHFVIPNSTFAWWGAWLSKNKEKIVVAPKEWYTDKNIDDRDIVPESWIKI